MLTKFDAARLMVLITLGLGSSCREPDPATTSDPGGSKSEVPRWLRQQLANERKDRDLAAVTETLPRTGDTPIDGDDGLTGEIDGGGETSGDGKPPDSCPTIRVVTFNVLWAHDHLSSSWYRAKTPADWDWKATGIAAALADWSPDIIALQEIGSIRETRDIAERLGKLAKKRYAVIHPWSPYSQQVSLIYDKDRFAASEHEVDVHKVAYATLTLNNTFSFDVITVQLPQRDKAVGEAIAKRIGQLPTQPHAVILGDLDRTAWQGDLSNALAVGICKDKVLRSSTVVGSKRNSSGIVDSVIVCGGGLDQQELSKPTNIWNYEADGSGRPWSQIPINDPPFRDLSDHLPLFAKITFDCPKEASPNGSSNKEVPP